MVIELKKTKRKFGILGIIFVFLLSFIELYGHNLINSINHSNEAERTQSLDEEETLPDVSLSQLVVQFIDVGQADAILIQNAGESMLIDAGNNEDGSKLVDYFQKMGIEKFKYVIGTHPHEDHIGGMDDILSTFAVDKIYFPDVITTTKTFEDVLAVIEQKKLSITIPEIGDTFKLGEAQFTVLYTGTDTEDLNDASIVLRMVYGHNSFLFMGDASSKVEKTLINDDIKTDVLKVGHHGSRYSSSEQFLDAVSSDYAIISCGKNNSYNHPHQETMDKLAKRNIEVYRTDELGTIIATSDGQNLKFNNVETNTNG